MKKCMQRTVQVYALDRYVYATDSCFFSGFFGGDSPGAYPVSGLRGLFSLFAPESVYATASCASLSLLAGFQGKLGL